ncbi:MAG: serine/threonine-protein kinase [Candidatus Eremiobacteraeota bacterium]|nr:serine/threonine-protein kinase [Candidatus Eremiobacteraeota bacterium]
MGLERSPVGKSNEPITLNVARFKGISHVSLYFTHKYYNSKEERIPVSVLMSASRIPEKGTFTLSPTVPVIFDIYYFLIGNLVYVIVLVLAAIAVLYLKVFPYIRRSRIATIRAAQWESLKKSAIDSSDPLAGVKLGDYLLIEKLGEGGMGSVYRAVPDDTLNDDESVAVKVIKQEALKDEEFVRRFKREVSITSRLIHPCILKVIDCGEKEKRMYMVMELIRGNELKSRFKEKGLPLATFWELYLPVLEALEYAHGQGIIHRDLKPDNIMITEKGRIVVMDFGLARGEQYSTITVSGNALGTPAYMAPEQIKGCEQDARSDQYSMGIIAWEMLAGKRPFDDENTVNIIFKHITEPPPPLRAIRRDIPEALEEVIMQMLSKDPEQRFKTIKEVRERMTSAVCSAQQAGTETRKRAPQ